MDNELELYLITVEKYLKNMPVSERIDVMNNPAAETAGYPRKTQVLPEYRHLLPK